MTGRTAALVALVAFLAALVTMMALEPGQGGSLPVLAAVLGGGLTWKVVDRG